MKKTLKDNADLKGSYRIRTWCSLTGKLIWDSGEIKNLIVASSGYGKNIIIRQLGNDPTYSIAIDSAGIGTGTTPPTEADTDLQTPVLTGITVADRSIGTKSLLLSFFITNLQLANGTYNEFVLKCGTQLFARSLIIPAFTKGSNQNTTVDYTISIN